MELVDIPKEQSGPGYFLKVTTQEAYEIIASLANQLKHGNANSGRTEWNTKFGYFSVGIINE